MSFQGLEFIRRWVKEHIYKPRIKGFPLGLRRPLLKA